MYIYIRERRNTMSVVLTRVDFRLIHGQVITRWLRQCEINEIVTVDTELSKDEFMQDVFKMAAPKGVKIRILSVEEAVKAEQNGELEKNRVLLLFKSVQELDNAVRVGLKLEEVQIGGLGGGPGRKAVNNAITLDRKDADTLLALEKMGISIYLQTTPDYPSETLQKAVAKL
jgi:D-glucosaminate PTS system EIIB component